MDPPGGPPARTHQPHDRSAGELLFVYGTLRRGRSNERQLTGSIFEGESWLDGAELYDLGPFPMAIAGRGRLWGELHRVGPELLSALDRFEGAPRLYQRQRLPLPDGRPVWIYLGRPRQVRHCRRLIDGIWPATTPSTATAAPDGPAA